MCFRCGGYLLEMTVSETIEAEIEYRDAFPESWPEGRRVRVCHDCYVEMEEDQPKDEWEQGNLL